MKPQFVLEEKMALDNGVKYGRPFCQYKQKVLPLNFTQIGTIQNFRRLFFTLTPVEPSAQSLPQF